MVLKSGFSATGKHDDLDRKDTEKVGSKNDGGKWKPKNFAGKYMLVKYYSYVARCMVYYGIVY